MQYTEDINVLILFFKCDKVLVGPGGQGNMYLKKLNPGYKLGLGYKPCPRYRPIWL